MTHHPKARCPNHRDALVERHPLMAPYIDAPEIWERGAFQDRDPVPLDWASIQDGSDYPGLKLPRPDSATITQNRGPDVK